MCRLPITTCIGLFLLLLLNGCATTPPYNPFSVAKKDIFATVDVIGLVPFYSQIKVYDLDTKLAAMEEQATSKLETAGFQVIPSSEYKKFYDEAKKVVGPIYDPDTGELNKDKKKTLDEQTLEEYLILHSEVDALMYGGIDLVKANWHANNASWHGANEPTSGEESFWVSFGLSNFSGTIPALSFSTYIERTDKTRLYSLYGGVQLAKWYRAGEFVEVPENLVLSDEVKINAGIARSMNALITKGAYIAKEVYSIPEVVAASDLNLHEQSVSNSNGQPTTSYNVTGTYASKITPGFWRLNLKNTSPKVTIQQTGYNVKGTFGKGSGDFDGVIVGDTITIEWYTVRGSGKGKWTIIPDSNQLTGSFDNSKWDLKKIE
jgi:hypothetical protein